jgi:type VI protein secretion system component Hcp
MASDLFMKIGNPTKFKIVVTGESTDDNFKTGPFVNAFELADFSWDIKPPDDSTSTASGPRSASPASTSKAAPAGKNAGTGAGQLGEFTIHKAIDSASPGLFKACLKKEEYDMVWIFFFQSGETPRKPYLVLKFSSVTVTAFSWKGVPGDGHHETKDEEVTFHANTMKLEYGKQRKDGTRSPLQVGSWDTQKHDFWEETRDQF